MRILPEIRVLEGTRAVAEVVDLMGRKRLVIYLLAYRYPIDRKRVERIVALYKYFLESIYYELCVRQKEYEDIEIAYLLFNKNTITKKHPTLHFGHRIYFSSFLQDRIVMDTYSMKTNKWMKDTGDIPHYIYDRAMSFINYVYSLENPEELWERLKW